MPRLPIRELGPTSVVLDDREPPRTLLAFAGCNYLGLSFHPAVQQALLEGMRRYGISATASRETTGNTLEHESLERELADHVGHDAALLTPEGYTANLALAETLATGEATRAAAAVVDERSHRSVGHAFRAAGLPVTTYRHRDAADARRAVVAAQRESDGGGVVLATDGVFAADGAVAPLAQLLDALPPGAMLMVDDCHGLGVLGPRGEGTLAACGVDLAGHPRRGDLCVTATLAKGLGCYGGAVIGSHALIAAATARSGLYRATTPVPPALAAAARAALRVAREDGDLRRRLRANIERLQAVLLRAGAEFHPRETPVVAFTLGTAATMRRIHDRLLAAGILAPLIDYPGGPAELYFRLSVSALHSDEEIDRLGAELDAARRAECAATPVR